MIQRIRNWLRTEYLRAAALLPRIMITSVVITVLAGILLTGVKNIIDTQREQAKIKIGYVAEDDILTKLLVSYVAGMDSVDEWCRFVSVTEEKGKKRLQNGRIAALLILPDQVVEEILSGTNAPATLLLPKESSVLGIVFEELADAGIRMLSVAQGEIYTIYELAGELGLNEEQLLSMCDDINGYNLGLMKDREDWFARKGISITGNEGMAVYYGSAILTIYLLVCGVLFGRYSKHSEQEQLLMWKRLGISPVVQVIGRVLMIAMLLILTLLPIIGLWVLPWLRELLLPAVTWQGTALVLVSVICAAAFLLLLYQMAERYWGGVVLVGLLTVVQGYLAGCFLPKVLLPEAIQTIAAYVPASYMRQAFSVFFSGDLERAGTIYGGLMACLAVLLFCNILVMYLRTSRHMKGESSGCLYKNRKQQVSGTFFGIYWKRLWHRKSFWCSLLALIVISVSLSYMEQESESRILAAFYDESGVWRESLCAYEGYIHFVECDSREEVQELVLHNEVECGYVFAADVKERLQQENANNSIEVYEDSDALMTDTVNEIVFEVLFTELSREWFVNYLENADDSLTVLQQKMTDGSTFSIQKEYWNTDTMESETEREERTTYPVGLVMGTAIFLCGLSGVWETIEDYRRYHFFKRKAGRVILVTMVQPLLCGVITAILIFLHNSY